MKKIRALVVDDSAFMRKFISDILSADPEIEVVDTARNGSDGVAKVKSLSPDVVTMDIEMPLMNGLEALKELMKEHPVPVVMLSSLTQEGAEATVQALELGAVDFVAKPSGSISLDLHKVSQELVDKVKTAAKARVNQIPVRSYPIHKINPKKEESPLASVIQGKPRQEGVAELSNIIVVGTSTGGPKALQLFLSSIPAELPAAILVVQHMPPRFTKSLSERLDTISSLHVFEAKHGQLIENGSVYIAPGDFHMGVQKKKDGKWAISLNQGDPKSGHRPSVDVLFESVAKAKYPNTYAVVMTGMGRDGSSGLRFLRDSGCKQVIAEDESTCVVFGMPKSAILSGKTDHILPLPQIGPFLVKVIQSQQIK
jgi:two-component system chemotaxis response regulator CheB